MWNLMKLAFRNIFRSRRRTMITFSAVSLGLALLVLNISFLDGIDIQSIRNLVNSQTSHITIYAPGYFQEKDQLPMDITIADPGRIQELLKADPGIKAAEARLRFGAGLIKGMDEIPCTGVGIEPEIDPDVFNIKHSMVEGKWLGAEDEAVVIGVNLARDVGLAVGDIITLRMIASSSDKDGEVTWNAVDLEIKGIFNTGNPSVDGQMIYLPMAVARDGLGLENEATEIVVRLHGAAEDNGSVEEARTRIAGIVENAGLDVEIYSWRDLAGDFLTISEMKTQRTAFIVMIMLFIASMGIVNTMLMAVLERTREIGMMTALGMKRGEIMKLFIMEGGFIGGIGSIVGCIAGGLAGWYFSVHGLNFGSPDGAMQKMTSAFYPIKGAFYADVNFSVMLFTFLLGTVVAVLACIYPALRAARLNPVEALRSI